MVEPIHPEVLIRQAESLAADLADHAKPVGERAGGPRAGHAAVVITGLAGTPSKGCHIGPTRLSNT